MENWLYKIEMKKKILSFQQTLVKNGIGSPPIVSQRQYLDSKNSIKWEIKGCDR